MRPARLMDALDPAGSALRASIWRTTVARQSDDDGCLLR